MIRDELLDILACPSAGHPLVRGEEETHLICRECQLAFPVIDGIPVLIRSEARRVGRAGSAGIAGEAPRDRGQGRE
jgi:uncharacterized protein YbaR (Trm112 family)